jgi:hypothetical protein
LPDPPDPYVKLYLMPGKKKKRKTQVVKDSGSPRYFFLFQSGCVICGGSIQSAR